MKLWRSSVEAEVLWASVPKPVRDQILLKVWCGHCQRLVPMGEATGKVKQGDLVLKGACIFCLRRVTRVVETSQARIPPN